MGFASTAWLVSVMSVSAHTPKLILILILMPILSLNLANILAHQRVIISLHLIIIAARGLGFHRVRIYGTIRGPYITSAGVKVLLIDWLDMLFGKVQYGESTLLE